MVPCQPHGDPNTRNNGEHEVVNTLVIGKKPSDGEFFLRGVSKNITGGGAGPRKGFQIKDEHVKQGGKSDKNKCDERHNGRQRC